MGKRYFCDYCDRTFQDNLHNRKKHLNGVQHLRAKEVWYNLFRDAATILQEEQKKKPCRKFLQTGHCDFGSNCRFSHMTGGDLEKLNMQVQEERRAKEQQQDGPVLPVGTIEAWLEKRAKRLRAAQQDSPSGTKTFSLKLCRILQDPHDGLSSPHSEEEVVFQYPPGWPPVQELPPSLRAPPLGGWTAPPGLHWG